MLWRRLYLPDQKSMSQYNIDLHWQILLGTASNDGITGVDLDAVGDIYVTGYTNGDLSGKTNSGGSDGFIAKYSDTGTQAWINLIGTSAWDASWDIAVSPNGPIYVSGYSGGNLHGETNSSPTGTDIFIEKYSNSGTREWTRFLGAEGSADIDTDADGNIYVSGYTGYNFKGHTNQGSDDYFIVKYSPSGDIVWSSLFGSTQTDRAESIAIAADSSIYVAGFTNGNLHGQSNSGGHDAFVSKVSSDGNLLWTRLIGNSDSQEGWSISIGDDGNAYVYGITTGGFDGEAYSGEGDVFVAEFYPGGNRVSTKIYGTSVSDYEGGITVDTTGNFIIGGRTLGDFNGKTNSGGSGDAFVSMYDQEGNHVSSRLIGSTAYDQNWGITGGLNGLYAVGVTNGNFSGVNSNSGMADGYLAKLVANGRGDYLDSNILVTPNGDGTYLATFAGITDPNGLTGVTVNYYLHWFDENGNETVYQSTGATSNGWTQNVNGISNIDQWYGVIDYVDNAGGGETIDSFIDPGLGTALLVTPAGPGGSGGSSSGGSGGSGGSAGPVTLTEETPSTPPVETPSTPPVETPATSPTTSLTPTPTQESPVLGIQPQETVTTVQLTTPLTFGTLQVTQAVVGTDQRDVITGSDAGEALAGGKGKDQMTGGGGPDAFLFETPGEFGKKSSDTVTDFDPDEGDKMVISKDAFEGVNKVKLDVASGKKDAKISASSNKTFIYDEKSGVLYFNENGKKDGFGDGGEFVKLLGATELSKSDFVIV